MLQRLSIFMFISLETINLTFIVSKEMNLKMWTVCDGVFIELNSSE